jgi:tRNA (guanine37-N1)-methyltransferase
MRLTVITIFPDLFSAFLATSLVGRAIEAGLMDVRIEDLRRHTDDPHRVVDAEPYGGGPGMVMKATPWIRAVEALSGERTWRVLLSPQGERLTDAKVRELAEKTEILFLCARYEGVDERVKKVVVDEEISIGDYVVSGGEVPAMVLLESISRQLPGVVGCSDSVENDSFRRGLLDYPHYTRPRSVADLEVPETLLSGDHAAIQRWREKEALRNTLLKRPDLLPVEGLSREQRALLEEVEAEERPHAKVND